MEGKILITEDALDIAQRIKEIDGDYFVVFCKIKNRFEVHNVRQLDGTLALVLPYAVLDERAVTHTRKTRAQNMAERLKEIDEHNERIAEKAIREQAGGLNESQRCGGACSRAASKARFD